MTSSFVTDIFKSEEVRVLLKNKYVLFIGDSVVRGMYKDLVKFLQTDQHLLDQQLKNKGEFNFENDELLEGGQKGEMSNDISYSEIREYATPYFLIKFYFITRCYSDYFQSICDDIARYEQKPDVVIMNSYPLSSGCWDLTRYGFNSIKEYKQNLPLGIFKLCNVLPSYSLFIWTTILPLSKDVKGGFMVPEVEYTKSKLREDVLEANSYARTVIDQFKLELIDLHYYFYKQTHRRAKDGIHWDSTSHRRITNILLNHICYAWKRDTPGRLIIKNDPDIFIRDNRESDEESEKGTNETDFTSSDDLNISQLPSDLIERIEQIKKPRLEKNENPNEIIKEVNENSNNSDRLNFYQQNHILNSYLDSINSNINSQYKIKNLLKPQAQINHMLLQSPENFFVQNNQFNNYQPNLSNYSTLNNPFNSIISNNSIHQVLNNDNNNNNYDFEKQDGRYDKRKINHD